MEKRYGPQYGEVLRLLETADLLDSDRIAEIAAAYQAHDRPFPRYCYVAAREAGRETETANAGHDMTRQVEVYGITYAGDPYDVQLVIRASGNAGLAMATEDLIGTEGYSMQEYARLMDPWLAGFLDQPFIEREEEDE